MKHLLDRAYAAQRAITWRRFVMRMVRDRDREFWIAVLYVALLAVVPLVAWVRG